MRILVTGASGFIGTALCPQLLRRGHTVLAMARSPNALGDDAIGVHRIMVPDIAGEFDRKALLAGVDVVVHLAAIAHSSGNPEIEIRRVNVNGAIRLAESAAGLVRRFIFMSSVKVHGEDSGAAAFSESDIPCPEDLYGRSKLEAERALAEICARSGIELVIIRPPLVYGPRVRANFLRLLQWVESGWPLPLGRVRNRRSMIYLGNLVDAVTRCTERPGACGSFLVSDEEITSTPELVSRIARALGRSANLVPVPPAFLRLIGALMGRRDEIRRLTGNLVVDATKARQLLDWRPPYSLDKGLDETVRWLRSMHA